MPALHNNKCVCFWSLVDVRRTHSGSNECITLRFLNRKWYVMIQEVNRWEAGLKACSMTLDVGRAEDNTAEQDRSIGCL